MKSITLQDCVDFLNELNNTDPQTIKSFLSSSMPISKETAQNHPHIQCCAVHEITGTKYGVKLVGLLNGLFKAEDKKLAVILDYPSLESDTPEKKQKAYDKGNFEVVKFLIYDKEANEQ